MYTKNSFLATLASDMRIQTLKLCPPVRTNQDFPDLGLRSNLFGSAAPFLEELPEIDPSESRMKVWMIRDAFQCNYILGKARDYDELWLMGPYATEDLGMSDISRLFEKAGISNLDLQYLIRYYHVMPHIRDQNLMYSILHKHCIATYGEDGFEIAFWEMEFSEAPRATRNSAVATDYQRDMLVKVYSLEKLIMNCVSEGNHHGAASAIRRLESQGLEIRTNSTIRDVKNYCIVFNTLCRIAARDGGVPPWEIDQCSREKSIQIENASDLKDLTSIRKLMLKDYCTLVRRARDSVYSALVQQAIDMIQGRFSQNVTLAEIAAELNHSPNYLSVKFRQETGKTFSDYLADTRLSYAKNLLKNTDLPIALIAEECGIPDNNYFARIFRLKEQMTPSQYRKKNKEH